MAESMLYILSISFFPFMIICYIIKKIIDKKEARERSELSDRFKIVLESIIDASKKSSEASQNRIRSIKDFYKWD